MGIWGDRVGLCTDFYELVMAQGYLLAGKAEVPAVFDYSLRRAPFRGAFVVFAGMADLLEAVAEFRYGADDVAYLRGLGFRPEFLSYLRSLRFRGRIRSAPEGEVVFPGEPLVTVEAVLPEAQLLETLVLNILDYESLVATKAARMASAAGFRAVVEMGLRRAAGPGGVLASRAAAVGGCRATSDVYACLRYGLEPAGTQAHSWIQSFPDELTAFRRHAEACPGRCVLLVDTYDTLRSGVPNAIKAARELARRGRRLAAIRLDSGDLDRLSRRARAMLDRAGLTDVLIMASGGLDEFRIKSLVDGGAPIDAFGVGTQLVSGDGAAGVEGVYKLAAAGGRPCLKFSDTPAKASLPGAKTVWRLSDAEGGFCRDIVALASEKPPKSGPGERAPEELAGDAMREGRACRAWSVQEAAGYARERLRRLPREFRRLDRPGAFPVGLSPRLAGLRGRLELRRRRSLAP